MWLKYKRQIELNRWKRPQFQWTNQHNSKAHPTFDPWKNCISCEVWYSDNILLMTMIKYWSWCNRQYIYACCVGLTQVAAIFSYFIYCEAEKENKNKKKDIREKKPYCVICFSFYFLLLLLSLFSISVFGSKFGIRFSFFDTTRELYICCRKTLNLGSTNTENVSSW